ncbi:PAS domain-containing sensor histidine kinase [Magnetococcus sp. PR-3]|uniref:PAS domain-containing sensor histidine kinase n=1 Tax=Magnetococcus sp. PR-3 TaxID=3120355 RepID=UPI002FCE1963
MSRLEDPSSERLLEYAEAVVETLREPLLVLDGSLKIIMASRSFYRTFHVSPVDTEGRQIYEVGNGQWNIPKLRELLESIIPGNTTIENFEVEHSFPVIGQRTMLLNARKIERLGDFPPSFLLAIEDITIRRLAEKALIEQAKLHEIVEHMTRHDLKGPLTTIIGFPEVLLEDENLTDSQRKMILHIQKSGYRMLEQINRSLDLYRMEQGIYSPNFQIVSPLSVLQQITQEFESTTRHRRVSILIEGDQSLSILAEELLVFTLFSNLLKNAVEASPAGSQVTINLSRKQSVAEVRVHNYGYLSENTLARFFDKLVTSDKVGGTGLGTYSARLITEALGGTIAVEIPAANEVLVTVNFPI